MTEPTQTPVTRTPVWLRIVLFVSLALNLMVVGIIAGHVLRDAPPRKVPRVDRIEGPMTFALSHEDRRAIGRALRDEYRQNRPTRQQMMQEYKGMVTALRADPFRPEQLEEAFQRQRNAANDRVEVGQRLLMDHLKSMSAEERHAFADRLEEGLRRGPPQKEDKPKLTSGDR